MEVYYTSVEKVVEVWEILKTFTDYDVMVGETLFREMFRLAPGSISLFGFGEGISDDSNSNFEFPAELFSSPIFIKHAKRVVGMLDKALKMMLNNYDVHCLGDVLRSLGSRHLKYGVKPALYIVVESALLRTMQFVLNDKECNGCNVNVWTPEVRKHFAAVFKFITKAMMMGAKTNVQITRTQTMKQNEATLRLQAMTSSTGLSLLKRRSSEPMSPVLSSSSSLASAGRRFSDPMSSMLSASCHAAIQSEYEDINPRSCNSIPDVSPPSRPVRVIDHNDHHNATRRCSEPCIQSSTCRRVIQDLIKDSPPIYPRSERRFSEPSSSSSLLSSSYRSKTKDLDLPPKCPLRRL